MTLTGLAALLVRDRRTPRLHLQRPANLDANTTAATDTEGTKIEDQRRCPAAHWRMSSRWTLDKSNKVTIYFKPDLGNRKEVLP